MHGCSVTPVLVSMYQMVPSTGLMNGTLPTASARRESMKCLVRQFAHIMQKHKVCQARNSCTTPVPHQALLNHNKAQTKNRYGMCGKCPAVRFMTQSRAAVSHMMASHESLYGSWAYASGSLSVTSVSGSQNWW